MTSVEDSLVQVTTDAEFKKVCVNICVVCVHMCMCICVHVCGICHVCAYMCVHCISVYMHIVNGYV